MCRYTRTKVDGQLRGRNCQNPKIIMEWKIKLDLQIFTINGMMTKSKMARIVKLRLPKQLMIWSQNLKIKMTRKIKLKLQHFAINDIRKKRAKIQK